MRRLLIRLGVALVMVSFAGAATAESYPARHLKLIVTSGPGAGPDLVARIIAEPLSKALGQQIVLLNQGGAGGAIAMRDAARAAPDGYTLLFSVGSAFTVLPDVQANLGYNVDDFVPIGFVAEQPFAIAVSTALNVRSVPELIAHSKDQAHAINSATGMRGGFQHLAAEAFRDVSGARLSMIYYPGSPQALQDVVAGRVPVIIGSLTGLAAQAEAGTIRLLAIGSQSRLSNFPDIPTVAESLPGFYAAGWFVLAAPPGTPKEIAATIRGHLQSILSDPQTNKRLRDIYTYARSMTPDELQSFMSREQQVWGDMLRRVKVDKP